MTFIENTIHQNLTLWSSYLEHPFLKAIRSNTLEQELFIHYLIEDTKYLKDYARVFGMAIFKSKTTKEITLFCEMLKFVEASENAYRTKILTSLGFDMTTIEGDKKEAATQDYTDFLIHTANSMGPLEMLFATLPCMLSYAYIGKRLLEENPHILEENRYAEWIKEYVCEDYINKCEQWMKEAEMMSTHCNEQEKLILQDLFHTASLHEQYFWDMSYQTKG